MGDSVDNTRLRKKSDMANLVNNKNVSKSLSIASGSKSLAHHPLRPVVSLNQWKIGKITGGHVGSFLIKSLALEAVRRFSRAKCPILWNGLQALQVLCYPPLKWIQWWNPLGFVVKGMQMLSRPLLLLSVVDALTDLSDCNNCSTDETENSHSDGNSQMHPESESGCDYLQCDNSKRTGDENSLLGASDENFQRLQPADWMNHLCQELEIEGITLPERINRGELQRFYVAANGDLSSLLSALKKTLCWRDTYRLLSVEELEMWSTMIFWHGLDVMSRPCLIVRLGLACTSLPPKDRPLFVQAIVSQVEQGLLHLVNEENPRITVLVDCQGLSPLRIPMQMMRYCCNLLQDHFPNILGCIIVIRLPPVVRVVAQTFIKVLKPVTKQKLRIEGDIKVLSQYLQALPSYLGGQCTCSRCSELVTCSMQQIRDGQISPVESIQHIVAEGSQIPEPTHQYDVVMDNSCSRTLRAAIVGILIFWVMLALIEGIYDPESRPRLPF